LVIISLKDSHSRVTAVAAFPNTALSTPLLKLSFFLKPQMTHIPVLDNVVLYALNNAEKNSFKP